MPNCVMATSAPAIPVTIGRRGAGIHATGNARFSGAICAFSTFTLHWTCGRTIMKMVSGVLAAVVLAGLGWSLPAQAQGLPQGTYLSSCSGARMEGDTLVARCRTRDGSEQRSALAGVNRCAGDIGNSNGSLSCNFGGRTQAVPVGPGYREPGYGSDRGERCGGLRREAQELRARMDREWNPMERARLESHLREVHEQEERCR